MLLRILLFGLFGLFVLALILWNKPILLEKIVVAEQEIFNADAMVLMAGSRYSRLPAIVRLYQEGVAPRILLTNDGVLGQWSVKYQRNLYQVEWAREYLLERGVPDGAIELLDYIDSGSYYDALNTRKYVIADGSIDSLLIVTSDYHSRRTLWVFNRVFNDLDIKIGLYPIPKDPNYKGRRLLVNTSEIVKLAYYWVRYGLLPVTL